MPAKFLDRLEAAAFVTDEIGLRIKKGTLQKYASVGGGPPYRKFGHRVVYTVDDLTKWAEEKLSAPRRSTVEDIPATEIGQRMPEVALD